MKNLFFMATLLLGFKLFSQYPIVSDSFKKAGIYRTFQEFKNNNPSIILDFKIYQQDRTIEMFIKKPKKLPEYGIEIDAKVGEKVGEIYRFLRPKRYLFNPKSVCFDASY